MDTNYNQVLKNAGKTIAAGLAIAGSVIIADRLIGSMMGLESRVHDQAMVQPKTFGNNSGVYNPVQQIPQNAQPKNPTNYSHPVRMHISERGLNLIVGTEKLRTEVYLDQGKKPTIGYGHLIKPGEKYTSISVGTARELLRRDLENAENSVRENIDAPLSQGMFDALTSLAYNNGGGVLDGSTLSRKLNSKDYAGAAKEFERYVFVKVKGKKGKSYYVKSEGLENRRQNEIELFSGNY